MDPVGTHSSFQVEMISPKCNVEKSRLPVGFCKSTSDCAWLLLSFLFFRATGAPPMVPCGYVEKLFLCLCAGKMCTTKR